MSKKRPHRQLSTEERLTCQNIFYRAYSQGWDLEPALSQCIHRVAKGGWLSGPVSLELMHLALLEGYSLQRWTGTIQAMIDGGTLTPHRASGGCHVYFGDAEPKRPNYRTISWIGGEE